MITGTTFSHRFAKYLQLDLVRSFNKLLALNFNIIRLCCYWDEIQASKDQFDYRAVKALLDICEEQKQDVIMTVGMKAPRWPEFYIPAWIQKKDPRLAAAYVLTFIEKTIEELDRYSCIKYWQVENEPLDPVWPTKQYIAYDDLTQEVNLIRKIDPKRKILINLWGNSASLSKTIDQAEDIADIIGLDIYYKQHIKRLLGVDIYKGPSLSDSALKKIIASAPKPVWITELQAEPWEKNMEGYKSVKTRSMKPDILRQNIQRAGDLNPEAILLWGSEYWTWSKKNRTDTMWSMVKQMIEKSGRTI